MATFNSLAGRMLIAMPGIDDPRFERAVIYVVAHTEGDAMGLAINRPIDGLSLPIMLDKLGIEGAKEAEPGEVMFGGPVERERGFVLHTDDYSAPASTLAVAEGIALTATREVLEAMADPVQGPRCAVLALGCAGWSPGQLEREIRENVWLTCEPDEALIFDEDHDTKWERALAKIGVSASQLSAQSGTA